MKQLLKRHLLIGCSCIAASLAAAATLAEVAPAPAEHQSASWQERRYSFAFMGFTTTYSCDGLADKLKALLLAAGARSDVQATSGACAGGFGRPDKFARCDLVFYVLVPNTAERGQSTSVDGTWRLVSLAARQPRELAVGDCELVEQFKTAVLPLLSTRNVQERSTCVPNQDSGSYIDLKFESLSAAPGKPIQAPDRS